MRILSKGMSAVLLFLILPGVLRAGECIDWPRVLTKYEVDAMTEGKVVVIEPFTNYTKKTEDEWMDAGLRDLLASMLASSKGLIVLSGLTAKYHPRGGNPDYVIGGMFQHIDQTLRVFIKLMQGDDKKLLAQYAIAVDYPQSNELFMRFADTARQIAQFLKTGIDEGRLASIRDATSFAQVYESYSRGRQLLEKFGINDIEVAKVWFEQAKRRDYKSPLGYQGMADLMTFLGYYHKQRKEPFGPYFEQAQSELVNMQRLAKRSPPIMLLAKKPVKIKEQETKIENRFLLGHAAFNEGLMTAGQANWQKAAEAFIRAATFVPEDAIAWYQLARVYEQMGNAPAASNALQKAYEVNPCIEK
jgi:tetratricopeptide (TPR) repeat protein